MNEWNNYFLESLAEITSSKRIFYSEYVDSGVPFYRSKEVINLFKREQVQTELFITHQRFSEIEAKFGVPKENDILLTSVGSLGIPYLVKANDKFLEKFADRLPKVESTSDQNTEDNSEKNAGDTSPT